MRESIAILFRELETPGFDRLIRKAGPREMRPWKQELIATVYAERVRSTQARGCDVKLR